MTTALNRLSGSAFELTLTIPWADVKAVYDKVFDELAAEIEVEGFRKGKAPKETVAAKVDKSKVYGEVINRILPDAYAKALAEHNLKPVVSPKIQIVSGEEEKDWQFIAKAAEKPAVDLDGYQEAIKAINAKDKIWTPGQKEEKKEEEDKTKKVNAIIEKLIEVCRVELADVLTESETNRLMSQLIDDVRQAGLTYEQYLASSSQTADQVRAKYHQQAQSALKLEFILDAVADDLKVVVEPAEIETIINKETDEAKKAALKEQSYILTSILRREKTIDKLLSL
ncbi:MAG: hypothetical protein M1484_03135 [Patescibacteria group bacterium]|nr:hypothetical protein [Patescibacteria group bacterium]MCL5432057.1 hypothetical protein [Patescibacteria group bacterium]